MTSGLTASSTRITNTIIGLRGFQGGRCVRNYVRSMGLKAAIRMIANFLGSAVHSPTRGLSLDFRSRCFVTTGEVNRDRVPTCFDDARDSFVKQERDRLYNEPCYGGGNIMQFREWRDFAGQEGEIFGTQADFGSQSKTVFVMRSSWRSLLHFSVGGQG